MAPFPMTLNEP